MTHLILLPASFLVVPQALLWAWHRVMIAAIGKSEGLSLGYGILSALALIAGAIGTIAFLCDAIPFYLRERQEQIERHTKERAALMDKLDAEIGIPRVGAR